MNAASVGNCCKSCVTRHSDTSHVTRHTSRVTRHTSHATRHTSRVTRHTSRVTRQRPSDIGKKRTQAELSCCCSFQVTVAAAAAAAWTSLRLHQRMVGEYLGFRCAGDV